MYSISQLAHTALHTLAWSRLVLLAAPERASQPGKSTVERTGVHTEGLAEGRPVDAEKCVAECAGSV
jgi:hypothetical protein